MSTELIAPPVATIMPKGIDIEVSAETPEGMTQSQNALIAWTLRKIELVKQEGAELRAAHDEAKRHKWKTSTLKKHADLADKRVVFYEKLKMALEHGYIIVPAFPVSMFAVRSKREDPLPMAAFSTYGRSDHIQHATALPSGVGEYQNPFPVVYERERTEHGTGKKLGVDSWADSWAELEFPASMAKPHIMKATSRAMALKIFDDFGILGGARERSADPIIVGRIKDPRSTSKFSPRMVYFMIAWHLDTETL